MKRGRGSEVACVVACLITCVGGVYAASWDIQSAVAQEERAVVEVKRSEKRELDPDGVREHNAALIAALHEGLPEREFEWEHLVIHHTASEYSSLERIDRYHRQKFKDPEGIEYHFLIGNGKKQARGLIELGRWPSQKRSIHLFKPEGAPNAITISLVGNLHEREIHEAQYEALLALIRDLMREYDLGIEAVTTHTRVDGNMTVCPGKHFPYEALIEDLSGGAERGLELTD